MDKLVFIEEKVGELRASEVKVAKCILSDPDSVIHSSISELADKAGVSDPTVLRFCRALGFNGFQDFKIHLAQSLIPQIKNIHEAVDGTEKAPELVKKVFESNITAIRKTLNTLDYDELKTSINLIAHSSRILLHGVGGSAAVAMDAHHKFFRLGIPCEWFEDTHMAVMAASMMKSTEVFIAISHSGSTKDIVEVLKVANKTGAETISIVSTLKSPVSKVSKHVLCVDAPETNFKFEPMTSRIAQLSVIDALAVGVSLMRSDEVLENLKKSRAALIDKRY
ncbi:MAG: MurR/RpiR family transcriptional regulator [Sphaerochaetaceae bacterium]